LVSDPERGEEVLLRRRRRGLVERHQIRRFRWFDSGRRPPLLLVLVDEVLAERRVGDVGRQARRIAAQDFVRRPIAGPHRVELVGTPQIGPGAALWLRDVRSERSMDGRASEAYERSMVHYGPYSRRRTTISTFCIIRPPPDPLQFRVGLFVGLANVVERIICAEF